MAESTEPLAAARPTRGARVLDAVRRLFSLFVGPEEPRPAWPGRPQGGEPALRDGEPCEDDCAICLQPLTTCVITPCEHNFHRECLEQYFLGARSPGSRAKCPLCRRYVHAPLPIEATALSGRNIEVVAVPPRGGRCHFDRAYCFLELGGFDTPGMLYVLTPNDDRHTPTTSVMWQLESEHELDVHLNFRSPEHVSNGGCEGWLRSGGWQRNRELRSTVSSGMPNGPYSGPVVRPLALPCPAQQAQPSRGIAR
jgi:hypothetical protein